MTDGPSTGTLYVVGTSIGNLEDVTPRALRTLREADLIAAEDTRVAAKLLSHYDIRTPVESYHQHSGRRKTETITEKLKSGNDVALISDAGMPGISDPGQELIAAAIAAGAKVVPIPGPNAAITAVAVSGFPCRGFLFAGYPPRRSGDRERFFDGLKAHPEPTVFYEAPRRLLTTLKSALAVLGDRPAVVARELTKLHEEIFRGTLTEAIEHFAAANIRGEVTVVLAGAVPTEPPAETEKVTSALAKALRSGLSERDAVRRVSENLGVSRKLVYAEMLRIKNKP